MLRMGALFRGVTKQTQTLQNIEEHRVTDREHTISLIQPIILGDDLLLARRKPRMRADDDIEIVVPEPVPLAGFPRFALPTDFEDARQEEVLELVLKVAIGPRVPAEPVIAEGVRRDPPPNGVRPHLVHRLVEDVDRGALAAGVENLAQHRDVDVPPGGQRDIGAGKRRDPGIARGHGAFGDRTKLREIDVRVRFEEAQNELFGGDIALGAGVILHVSWRALLIERQILGRLRHRHAEELCDVGAIDRSLPEQTELDEL
ncbi:hypothetical protein SDC9_25568 [bioreactor metagenome]|uniref:Uncharacterized protein n=1 Tax=bioreactor metagenome TaxID=1076179 RepID=A0A644UL39_9ZZZZ